MLSGVTPSGKKKRPAPSKPTRRSGAKTGKAKSAPRTADRADPKGEGGFLEAFAKLLRSKKVPVPKGLADAPPEAYADQPASFVEQLERYSTSDLKAFAAKVAGYTTRRADRARSEWERSPLIAELRRRGLPEPQCPERPAGVSVSLTKPLAQWTDRELVKAATEWSRRSSRS
jgi:hypothetical protein